MCVQWHKLLKMMVPVADAPITRNHGQPESGGGRLIPPPPHFYCADAISVVSLPVPMTGIVMDAGWAASCKIVTWE
jgi:hypothetical protein